MRSCDQHHSRSSVSEAQRPGPVTGSGSLGAPHPTSGSSCDLAGSQGYENPPGGCETRGGDLPEGALAGRVLGEEEPLPSPYSLGCTAQGGATAKSSPCFRAPWEALGGPGCGMSVSVWEEAPSCCPEMSWWCHRHLTTPSPLVPFSQEGSSGARMPGTLPSRV